MGCTRLIRCATLCRVTVRALEGKYGFGSVVQPLNCFTIQLHTHTIAPTTAATMRAPNCNPVSRTISPKPNKPNIMIQ